jgi:transcriptional regulator with XRE-family HTH domain
MMLPALLSCSEISLAPNFHLRQKLHVAPPSLGDRISFFLARAGIKQIDLARRVDVAPSVVTAWVQDASSPRHENLEKLVGALGIDLSTFFGPLGDDPAAARE